MTATKLFDAGFDLVSVVPPGAPISPNSRLDPTQLGKAPGKKGQSGWYGYPFTTEKPTREDVEKWEAWGANIGILGDRFPGLDIDIDVPSLATWVALRAIKELGPGAARTRGNSPRKLFAYATDAPFERMAVKITLPSGKSAAVEWLGAGRQYVVAGTHPTGAAYAFDAKDAALPVVTRASARAFLETIAAELKAKGLTVEIVGDGVAKEAKAPPQAELYAPSLEQLESVVRAIPNDETFASRDDYITMGHAIKAAGAQWPADAYALWLEWALSWPGDERNPEGNLPETVEADWGRMQPPYRVGWHWLQDHAQAAGDYLAAQDEFTADPDATPPAPPAMLLAVPDRIELTDEWAVDVLLPMLKDKLRYIPARGGDGIWFIWRGHKWEKDTAMDHETLVRDAMRRLSMYLRERGDMAPTKGEGTKFIAAATRFQSAAGITSVLRLIRARVACNMASFDTNPIALNTPAGVIDLATMDLYASTPEQMMARSTAVAPASKGTPAPSWKRFLRDLTEGDADLERFLQKYIGYSLSGDMSEKVLVFFHGSDSDTGKSTFVNVISRIFGDYADSVDAAAFISSRTERIPAELARLPGVRLVTATEPAAGQSWDEKRVKAITGGDVIEARFLHQNPFTYRPQFKIAIVGNHEPEIRTVDDAMLRRILIVPFEHKVPREKQIANLAEKLIEREGAAILSWMLEGYELWQEEGLKPPASVIARTRVYIDEEDSMQQWLDAECELGKGYSVTREELHRSWSQWCYRHGEREAFGLKAMRRKFQPYARKMKLRETRVDAQGSRQTGYEGIRLRPYVEASEFTAEVA